MADYFVKGRNILVHHHELCFWARVSRRSDPVEMDDLCRLLGGPSEFEAVVTVLRRFEGIRGESEDEVLGSARGSGNDRVRVVFWLSLVSESPMHPN